jgi:hypothetical protein
MTHDYKRHSACVLRLNLCPRLISTGRRGTPSPLRRLLPIAIAYEVKTMKGAGTAFVTDHPPYRVYSQRTCAIA